MSQAHDLYRILFEQAADALALLERDRFIECNATLLALFGSTRQQVVGQSVLAFSPPVQPDGRDSAQTAQAYIEAALAGQLQRFEWQHLRADGQPFEVQVILRRVEVDGRMLLYASWHDLAVSREAERLLRENVRLVGELSVQQRTLQTILDSVPVGVFVIEAPGGRPLLANRRAQELLGRGIAPDATRDELGQVYAAYIYGTDEPYPTERMPVVRGLYGESAQVNDMEVRRPDGTYALLQVNGAPVLDEQGKVVASVVAFMDITAQRHIQERIEAEVSERTAELEAGRRRLTTLMSNLPGMAYRCLNQPDWPMEFVSEGAFELTGYRPEELIESRVVAYGDLIHPDDRQRVWETVQEGVQAHRYYEIEYRILDAEGQERWVWERGVGIYAPDGSLESLEGFIEDITARKMAEAEVLAVQEQLRSIAANVPGVVYRFYALPTGELGMTYVSPRAVEIFELKDNLETFFGEFLAHVHPDDRPGFMASIQEAIEHVRPWHYEGRFVKSSGEVVWFSGSSTPTVLPDRLVFDGLLLDITARRSAEMERERMVQALQESETRFRHLFEDSVDANLLIEGDRFVDCNRMAVQLLRYQKKEDLLNVHPADVSPEFQPDGMRSDEKQYLMIQRAREQGSYRFEWIHRRADGQDFPAEVVVTPITIGDREIIHVVMRDITQRKRAEAERERLLERRALQNRVIAQISQELAGVPQLDELFRRVVNLIHSLGYYHAQVFRYDPARDAMALVYGYGEAGAAMLAAGHHLPMGKGVVGTAALGESVLASNVRQSAEWVPNPHLPETRGELAVPIRLHDQVLGVLDVQSDRADALGEDDLVLLESLAGPIAVAMEAARLFQEASTLRQFAEASSQGLSIADLQGNIVYVNPALAHLLGEPSAEELIGKSILSYYSGEMRDRVLEQVLPTVRREGRWDGELVVTTRRNTQVPTQESYFIIRDRQGEPLYIADIMIDITERRRAEAELNERLRELDALYRTMSREGWQDFRESAALPGGFLFDPALLAVETVDDSDPRRVLGEAENPLIAPLNLRGEPIGLVGVAGGVAGGVADAELLQAILDQAAEALESVRLAEMTRQALAEAEATHRRYLHETWREFLAGRGKSIGGYLATSGQVLAAPDYWRPEMELAVVRQQPVTQVQPAPAREQAGALPAKTLALPIRHRGQTIGVIDIIREGEAGGWSEDELTFIQSLVDEVGDLIEAERLFEESEFTRAQTELLYQASQRISAAESPEQVYSVVLETIASTAIDQIALFLFERPVQGNEMPTRRELVVAFWDRQGSEPPVAIGTARAVEQDPFLTLLAARQPVVVADTETDERIGGVYKEAATQMGARALALIPLMVAEEWQGYILILCKSPYVFTEDELRIYRSVGDQAAIVLRSLRLYQDAESRARREQLIRQITNRMRVHADVDSILSTAVRELGQALGVSRAFIRLVSEVPESETPPVQE